MTENIVAVELAVKIGDKITLAKQLEKHFVGVKVLSTNNISLIVGLDRNSHIGIEDLQNYIEKNYKVTTVIQGVGDVLSAVAQLSPSPSCASKEKGDKIVGVVRISQLDRGKCYFDGLLSGVSDTSTKYSANVHEYGDLSGSGDYANIGTPIVKVINSIQPTKSLSKQDTSSNELRFTTEIPDCDVSQIIGRALAITKHIQGCAEQIADRTEIVSAGIVSRASTVDSNLKRICTCSGKTIWQEREDVTKNS